MNSRPPSRFVIISFAAGIILTSQIQAATVTWITPGAGNWNDGFNWSTGNPPSTATADVGLINNGGTAVIDASQTVATGSVTLADTTGSSGNMVMSGGSLTTTNNDIRIGGNGGATGGTGVFSQSGGSVIMNAGNLNVGFGNTATGVYNLSGGSMLINAGFILAIGNIGTGTVSQSGGDLYVRSATTPANSVIQLGRNSATAPASGTYTLGGGTAAARNFQFGRMVQTTISGTSTNTFNLQGGTLITNGVSVLNTSVNATNTFNFTGGNLIANSIGLSLANNGGTLSPDFADFTGVPLNIASIPINLISTLAFTGANSYVQGPTGTLDIDIAALGSNDLVDIGSGAPVATAILDGTILVNLVNNFDPAIGSTFDILAADTITDIAAVNGQTPSGNTFDSSIVTGFDGRQVLRLTVVPEPGSFGLIAASLLTLAFRRARQKATR